MRRLMMGTGVWFCFCLLLFSGEINPGELLKHCRRGTNFKNYLEAPRGQNWGATYSKADLDAMAKEGFEPVRQRAERLGLGWAVWDWKAGFRYWENGKPAEGLKEALFGKSN